MERKGWHIPTKNSIDLSHPPPPWPSSYLLVLIFQFLVWWNLFLSVSALTTRSLWPVNRFKQQRKHSVCHLNTFTLHVIVCNLIEIKWSSWHYPLRLSQSKTKDHSIQTAREISKERTIKKWLYNLIYLTKRRSALRKLSFIHLMKRFHILLFIGLIVPRQKNMIHHITWGFYIKRKWRR